jgi:integrase
MEALRPIGLLIMGEIRRRERRGRIVYLARHYAPDGRKVSKQFDKKYDAEDWLADQRHAINAGTYVDPNRSKIKMEAWADEWLKGQGHLKQGTRARYKGIVERYVKPRWGTTPLNKITHSDVAAWISSIKLSASSVRHVHRVLHLILELAVRDGRIVKNPATGVKLPRLPKAEKRFLTREQVFDLADAAAQHPYPEVAEQYRVLILLLAHTGLRWGEAAGLKVKRLDLMRRRLTVAETLIDDKTSGRLVWETPKNHAQRQVPFPAFLADMLAEVVAGKDSDDLVFTSARGKPMSNGNFRRYTFDPAVGDAGLSGLTPHDLRHTAASLAVSAGANVKAVQRMLGHASATMTLDTYAGLFDDDLDGVASRMDAEPPPRRHHVGTSSAGADVIDFPK